MKNQIDFQKFIPVSTDKNIKFILIKISVMKNQINFPRFIPVLADKYINHEEPDGFPEIYTCFN